MNIKEAKLLINYAAERAHKKHITSGFGMTMVYQEKSDEAADFIAANYPKKLTGFPLIQAEVTATKKTAKQVADNIITQKSKWIKVAAKIEKIRLKAIADLEKSNIHLDENVKLIISSIDKI